MFHLTRSACVYVAGYNWVPCITFMIYELGWLASWFMYFMCFMICDFVYCFVFRRSACLRLVFEQKLEAAGHNISEATIIQLKVSARLYVFVFVI